MGLGGHKKKRKGDREEPKCGREITERTDFKFSKFYSG